MGIGMLMSTSASAAIQLLDSTGHVVQLPTPAQRIISLSPNLTEILALVGGGSQLVGRDKYSDYPTYVTSVPIVGDYFSINHERLVRLRPDLVLLEHSASQLGLLRVLKQLQIPFYINRADHLNSIARTINDIGRLSGHTLAAKREALRFSRQLSLFRAKHHPKVTVFYELWHKPLLTVNDQTLIGEVIVLCGGRNLGSHFKEKIAKISDETVVRANPDIILTSVKDSSWYKFKSLRAVRERQIFFIDPDELDRTGPRLLQGVARVCHIMVTSLRRPTA